MNQTQSISGTQNLTEFNLILEDNSTYKWNCLAYDTASNSDWGDSNFTLTINSSYNFPPEVILQYPSHGNTSIPPGDVTLSVIVIDPEGSDLNVTYFGREKNDTDWTLVALPDTQRYARLYPSIFDNQTLWINTSKENESILFVTHEGDIVDDWNVIAQWNNANNSMSILDNNNVSYGLAPGNHDMNSTRGTPYYNQYFPPERFNKKSWYGGNFSQNDNNYEFFSAGGIDYIIFHLEFCPRNSVITWANDVLKNNTNRSAIITTHGFLNKSADRNVHVQAGQAGGCSGTYNTQYLWDNLIFPNNKTFLVLAGHVNGESRRTDNNIGGRSVHQLLANYQDWWDPTHPLYQRSGYLRRMKFIPSQNKIEVKTYSPYLNESQCSTAGGTWRNDGCYETDVDSEFVLDDTSTYLGRDLNVINGTNATFLWKNLKPSTAYEWFAEIVDSRGAKTIGPRWTFTTTS